ncbi:hypothetical protein EDB85DRAFT_1964808 [Lactarius pseudohatsudake]|nr:hypothetical protein EDB85DRAFT_1964808 [Lactarius pseudohatsudake]
MPINEMRDLSLLTYPCVAAEPLKNEGHHPTPIDERGETTLSCLVSGTATSFTLMMATLPTATYCGVDAAPSDATSTQPYVDKQPETVITSARISNGISSSDKEPMVSPLDVVIPEEHLPDVLEVYDKDASTLLEVISLCNHGFYDKEMLLSTTSSNPGEWAEYRSLEKFLAHSPIKYVRKYPKRIPTMLEGEEMAGDMSKASANLDSRAIIGQLDLSRRKSLGSGSHSCVFLSLFTLPSCATPSVRGEVAVKFANLYWKDREMLKNEAEIYDKFPCELQESTLLSPPVVPKFFGYYTPSFELVDSYLDSYKSNDEDKERAKIEWRDARKLLQLSISPILLLEPCGERIKDNSELSTSTKDTILGMFDRLHNARFTQKSTHRGNVLVQPGPLTHPLAERSLDNLSYRIIDFGRGKYYDERHDESHFADKEMKREQSEVRQRICDGHC